MCRVFNTESPETNCIHWCPGASC